LTLEKITPFPPLICLIKHYIIFARKKGSASLGGATKELLLARTIKRLKAEDSAHPLLFVKILRNVHPKNY